MKLRNTPSSINLPLAALGLCGLLGLTRPALADEPGPAVLETAPLPRVFDGTAGFLRLVVYSHAVGATVMGVALAFQSNTNANRAEALAVSLSEAHGLGACRKPLAVNVRACDELTFALSDRDTLGGSAVGAFVFAGVAAAAATASIWLWRTPGISYWLPDLFRVTPTAGPKSGGVILQGSW